MFGSSRKQRLVTLTAAIIMSATVIAAIAFSPATQSDSGTHTANVVPDLQESDGEVVTLTGTSHCAKCSFGLRPLNASGELGYALRTDSGTIAVIEDVHQQYSSTYQDRFSSHQATVTGTVLKRSDNVVWIQPTSLVVTK